MAAWYRQKGWTQALDLDNQMFAILINERPTMPEQEIAVLLKCANALFIDSISFKESGWVNLPPGNVVLRSVGIEMTRVSHLYNSPIILSPLRWNSSRPLRFQTASVPPSVEICHLSPGPG
jgi:hypothetical protein